MKNLINKILKYFGYIVKHISEIEQYMYNNESLSKSLLDRAESIEKLKYNHRIEIGHLNRYIKEYHKEKINLQLELKKSDSIIEGQLSKINKLKDEYNKLLKNNKDKYKDINRLRSNVKSLTESRDNYKDKYKKLCGKIALKNIRK